MKLRYLLIGLIVGLLIGWWWAAEERQEQSTASAASPKPAARPASSQRTKDALVEIEGIGPAYERALNALGVFTFGQLASQDADTLAAQMSARVSAERIRRERWIEQAKSRTK